MLALAAERIEMAFPRKPVGPWRQGHQLHLQRGRHHTGRGRRSDGLDVTVDVRGRPAAQGHDRRLIPAADAADLLGVPKTWVLAEARANRIPHVRLGRYVRFEANELEAWWRARRRGPSFGHPNAQ